MLLALFGPVRLCLPVNLVGPGLVLGVGHSVCFAPLRIPVLFQGVCESVDGGEIRCGDVVFNLAQPVFYVREGESDGGVEILLPVGAGP